MSERQPSSARQVDAERQPDAERIRAAIAAARLALDQAELALIDAVPEAPAQAAKTAPPAKSLEPNWVTMGKASEIGKCSIETMTKHVVKNGLGVKPAGGQWRVDELRVRAWREGKPFEPLIPYPTE
jgi:hypothetical protein